MLSSVLTSKRAIAVNIHIMRVYTRLREMLLTHKDVLAELEKIKQQIGSNTSDIELIFNYLKQLEAAKQQDLDQQNRKPIGYKTKEKK